ncbi:MAG: IS21-like element helper ATPase IstB [Candidatus Omnitrophota bacterium]
MLTNPTTEKLRALKLHGMAKSLEEQKASRDYDDLSFEERMGILIDRELTEQENRRLTSRLKRAKLRHEASMEDIDYRQKRGLDKSLMRSLAGCSWIKERLNILLTGPCGAGKSFIACALGHKACLTGYKVIYFRATRLFEGLSIAKGDGRYPGLMNSIAKTDLLIIDDWGLSVLTNQERTDMLEIVEDRHGIRSTIITSQLPVEHWHETIGNPTLADAILDRLIHNAHKIQMKGGSMRKIKMDKPSGNGEA